MLGVHASAWAIIHYGYIARKQGLTGVCLDSLSRFVQTFCASQNDKPLNQVNSLQMFFAESTRFPAFQSWTVSKRSDNRSNAIYRWLAVWASKSYKRLVAYVSLNTLQCSVLVYHYLGGVLQPQKTNGLLAFIQFEGNFYVANLDLTVINCCSLQQTCTFEQQLLCRTDSFFFTSVRLQF